MNQSTMITQLDSIRNVVVVGESGVGKSSVINLIIGKDCCHTGNDVRGFTQRTECHDLVSEGRTFRLWDTPGLTEGSGGAVLPKQAQDILRSLLSELKNGGGVHLLIFCIRGISKVTKGTKRTYDTVVQIRDKVSPDIPLVAVITELEKRSAPLDIVASMENWWTDSISKLSNFQMKFSGHACITTLTDDCYPELPGRRWLCQELVRDLIVEGALSNVARNIIIVGEVGVGKSSLVNLILGVDRAPVGNDMSLIKTSPTCYDWKISNRMFHLWDMPGIGGGLYGGGFQKRAQEGLQSLFTDLSTDGGGVHLLIFCLRGTSRAMATTKQTYDHIIEMRDEYSPNTPVVAVITKLEEQSTSIPFDAVSSMEQWWMSNSGAVWRNSMSFVDHACITCSPDDRQPPVKGRREACQGIVHKLITQRSLHPRQLFYLKTFPSKDLNVMLFGETGVGKSSLINLLAGRQIAPVSLNSTPCTLEAEEYQFQLGRTTVRLWDTVGLEEPERDKDKDKDKEGYLGAIEKAVALIKQLNRAGGISLFLFCIRGNRITQTTKSNYRLFYEVLGKKEVPIARRLTSAVSANSNQ